MPTSVTASQSNDSDYITFANLNNNLVNLFKLMSVGKWTGQFVNLGACMCSVTQILQALNNNVVSFFNWFSANGGSAGGAQSGLVDLANGTSSKAVVFATPFAAPPSVVCVVAAPDNTGYVITVGEDGGSVTINGFTAMLGAATPVAGYKLLWIATPRTQ